jgi:hypothetical protein
MAPLLVTLPDLAVGGQVWVRTEAGEPKADWRPHPHATWTPLGRSEDVGGIGGSVEVAP